MRKIVLLPKTVLADGLTYSQAMDALKKASDRKIPDLMLSVKMTDNGWALCSESRTLNELFLKDHTQFIIEVPDTKQSK